MARRKSTPESASMRRNRRNIKLDREIRIMQSTTIPLLLKLPFSRLVREIMQEHKENYRITATALDAIQEACEYYLSYLFNDAYLLTYHRKRVTLDPADIRMVLHLRKLSHK